MKSEITPLSTLVGISHDMTDLSCFAFIFLSDVYVKYFGEYLFQGIEAEFLGW